MGIVVGMVYGVMGWYWLVEIVTTAVKYQESRRLVNGVIFSRHRL
jgi:hypothetical protein